MSISPRYRFLFLLVIIAFTSTIIISTISTKMAPPYIFRCVEAYISERLSETKTLLVQRRQQHLNTSTLLIRKRRLVKNNIFNHTNVSSSILPFSNITSKQDVVSSTTGCSVNENGFFGYPSRQVYEVSYFYQVTVITNTSTLDIVRTISPALDISITNAIIPYLFFQCSVQAIVKSLSATTKENNNSRFLQSSTGQEEPTITGISTRGVDQFLLNGVLTCSGNISAGDCYVVKGQVTVIGNNFVTSDALDAQVLPAIQYVIQASLVIGNISNVLSVQYLNFNRSTVSPITTPPLPESKAPISTNNPTSAPTRTPIISSRPTSYVPFTFAPVNALPTRTPGTTASPFTAVPFKVPTATPLTSLIPITMAPQFTSSPFSTPVITPTVIPTRINTLTPIMTNPVRNETTSQSPFTCWQCSLFGIACFLAFLVVVFILILIRARYRQRNQPRPDQGFAEVVAQKDSQQSKVQTDEEDTYEPPPSSMTLTTQLQPYVHETNNTSSNIDLIKPEPDAIPNNAVTTTMQSSQDMTEDYDEFHDNSNGNETEDNSNANDAHDDSNANDTHDDSNANDTHNTNDVSIGHSVLYYQDEDNIEEYFEQHEEDEQDDQDETEGTYEEETVEATYREGDDEYAATEVNDDDNEDDVDEVFDEISYMEGDNQYEVNEEQVKWVSKKLPFDDDHTLT